VKGARAAKPVMLQQPSLHKMARQWYAECRQNRWYVEVRCVYAWRAGVVLRKGVHARRSGKNQEGVCARSVKSVMKEHV